MGIKELLTCKIYSLDIDDSKNKNWESQHKKWKKKSRKKK